MPTAVDEFKQALHGNAARYGIALEDDDVERLSEYHELLRKWNDRLHLVAPCAPATFATRHVLESLMLLSHLPRAAAMVDVGTGGGLPIIPCLIVRDDLHATLIESSQRKSAFLREALRSVKIGNRARIITSRFEFLDPPDADFVTCRALDHFAELLPKLLRWVPPNATLLLFVGEQLRKRIESTLPVVAIELIPGSERRFLLIANPSNHKAVQDH